jgi:hypothetical protein
LAQPDQVEGRYSSTITSTAAMDEVGWLRTAQS